MDKLTGAISCFRSHSCIFNVIPVIKATICYVMEKQKNNEDTVKQAMIYKCHRGIEEFHAFFIKSPALSPTIYVGTCG